MVGGDMEFIIYIIVILWVFYMVECLVEFKVFFELKINMLGLMCEIKMDIKVIVSCVVLVEDECDVVNVVVVEVVK